MKSNDELEIERFYEIAEVKEGDCWHERPGSQYSIVGAIVQPTEQQGKFMVIKACPNGYLSGSVNETLFFGSDGSLTIRPLNKKDQAKLQRMRDQFCGD